jgi:hypothetical protein
LCQKLFQYYNCNNGLWVALKDSTLESLIEKAKEHEKKYEWLQAAEEYKKAVDLVLNEKDVTKVANLQERIGFSFYRASLQAQSNTEFRKILKKSIIAYEKESKLLKTIETEESQVNRIHADALTCYAKSWYETDPKVIKKLLDEWWTLENQVLTIYEHSRNLLSVGRICNELLEYSIYDRFWLVSDSLEQEKMYKESIILAKKTIEIFYRLNLERIYHYAGIRDGVIGLKKTKRSCCK